MRISSLGLLFVLTAACSAKSSTDAPVGDSGTEEDVLPTAGLERTKGLAVAEVAVMQGPKVSVAKDGAASPRGNASVIVGRQGILRVYVKPDDTWTAREVVAKLVLESGGAKKTFTEKKSILGPSTDEALESSFNFTLDVDVIAADTAFSVELLTEKGQTSPSSADAARYPADGAAPLGAIPTGEKLQVMIVPIKYNADGSGRLPDTSAEQLEVYRRQFMRIYPAREVEITVRSEPYAWSQPIQRNGSGFNQILNAIIGLRQKEAPAKGVYYYGAFQPANTFAGYCVSGCVAGLSPLATNPGDSWTAASVGLGYTGEQSTETAVHEVGHGHGRKHSPCSPGPTGAPTGTLGDADPAYPYGGAKIGPISWDVIEQKLVPATNVRDFMSYCEPTWVSDWSFGALAKRMAFVYGVAREVPGPVENYQMFSVDERGALSFGPAVETGWGPRDDARPVTIERADGSSAEVVGHFYPYDHLPGGMLVVPVGKGKLKAVSVKNLVGLPGVVRAVAPL